MILSPSWLSTALETASFFSSPEGEILRGVFPALNEAEDEIWFPGSGGGVILCPMWGCLAIPFPCGSIVGGTGLWLCTGYKGGVVWPTGGWLGNGGGMDGWVISGLSW